MDSSLLIVVTITALIAGVSTFLSRKKDEKHLRRFFNNWFISFSSLLGSWMIMIILFKASIELSLVVSFAVCITTMIIANVDFKTKRIDQEAA